MSMKPIIPKTPAVPSLSQEEIGFLTSLTFGEQRIPQVCDALFVFGGTHAGHWEKASEAYKLGLVKQIIVTGGVSPTGTPNPDWGHGKKPEADVIVEYLLEAGIPKDMMVYENQSTNSLENVLFAKEIFDFECIQSLLFVCKSHVTGRQWRTLSKHLPSHLDFIAFSFDAVYQGISLSRDTWMDTEIGRSRIWGEYLRIIHYGNKGDILALDLDDDKEK